ncbi:helix-turn-helix domain-containing protein [Rhodococcus ruber]|uniref:helix-turn-helix domain-containing protein n=1 Tax=Rhodococcus ruber TaxID=1830 RepID=UPI001F2BB821|nr:helix-turn-helix domain-containing protein [Rhodococcus ruber]
MDGERVRFLGVVRRFDGPGVVQPGLESARQRGRVGGRPTALTAAKKNAARKLLGEGHSVAEVAEILGIGRSTLYRSIPQLSH